MTEPCLIGARIEDRLAWIEIISRARAQKVSSSGRISRNLWNQFSIGPERGKQAYNRSQLSNLFSAWFKCVAVAKDLGKIANEEGSQKHSNKEGVGIGMSNDCGCWADELLEYFPNALLRSASLEELEVDFRLIARIFQPAYSPGTSRAIRARTSFSWN